LKLQGDDVAVFSDAWNFLKKHLPKKKWLYQLSKPGILLLCHCARKMGSKTLMAGFSLN
jgi:hypothetical protein